MRCRVCVAVASVNTTVRLGGLTQIKPVGRDLPFGASARRRYTGRMAIARSIPLIRAAAIAPMRRWLSELGVDPASFLNRVELDWVGENEELLPIPLRGAVRLLVEIARVFGPDAPLRIARDRGIFEIGPIGVLGLGGPTARAGLHAIARNMPRHCTHEFFTVEDRDGLVRVGDGWAMNIGDPEARHHVQQYVAALVEGICRAAGGPEPWLSRVVILPHPQAGLGHLRPWLGERATAGAGGPLEVDIADAVADRAMPEAPHVEAAGPGDERWTSLRDGDTLADSVALLVASMLPRTWPSIGRIAGAAGASARTLRRRLAEEGTTLSDVVDRTRADLAIARLQDDPPTPLSELARELGYAHQAALTRAVKRWTGASPRELANGALLHTRGSSGRRSSF